MKASVVIAWKDLGDHDRRRALQYVLRFWERNLPDAEVVVEAGPEPFTRSRALNAAIRRAAGDVLLEVGPDSIATPSSVRQAIKRAAGEPGLVLPHDRWFHLTRAATNRLLAGAPIESFGPIDATAFGGNSVDLAAFSRATWEAAGGYDERFGIWGGDDAAFAIAAGSLVAPLRRVAGTWLHLYHPVRPESVPGHPGYLEQHLIVREYQYAAAEGPDAVRALIARR